MIGGSLYNNNAFIQHVGHNEANVVSPEEALDDLYDVNIGGAIGSLDNAIGLA